MLFTVPCKPLRKKKKKKVVWLFFLPRVHEDEDNITFQKWLCRGTCFLFQKVLFQPRQNLSSVVNVSFSFSFTIFFFLSFLHLLSNPISFSVFFLSFFHSLNRQRPLKSKRTQARNGDGFKEHPIMNHAWLTHPFQGPSCRRQQIIVQL